MNDRDRSEGWKHGKRSGHANEVLIKKRLETDSREASSLHNRLFGSPSALVECEITGISEIEVPSIVGGTTKAKGDLRVAWRSGNRARISIKKSAGGQVHFPTLDRLFDGFAKHFSPIPMTVQEAFRLYFGPVHQVKEILRQISTPLTGNVARYQIRKQRLVWDTLTQAYPAHAKSLLSWLDANKVELFELCFRRGLAVNPDDWATAIWYRNLLPNEDDEDHLFTIDDLRVGVARPWKHGPNTRMGGSTLLLPFGSVQWHQGKPQFRHDHGCLSSLATPR